MTAGRSSLPSLLWKMKTILKPTLIFAIALMFWTNGSFAQSNGTEFSENGTTFPYLTLNQLASYYEMDSAAFDMIMKEKGFAPTENIYSKGDLKTSKMVFGKTKQFGVSVAWISKNNTNSLIAKLLEKTPGAEKVSAEDGFYFIYKKYIITVKSTKASYHIEEINIIERNKNPQN